MEKIIEINSELKQLKINLRKSINKTFNENYIKEKLDRLLVLTETVNKIIEKYKNTKSEEEVQIEDLTTITLEFEKQIKDVEKILKNLKVTGRTSGKLIKYG